MLKVRSTIAASGVLLSVCGATAFAQKELPLKYVGPPTVPAITAGDLMTRLYKYADDSMGGRAVGTEFNIKATAYIEAEVRRLGLVPAGQDGGYFQNLPIVRRSMDSAGTTLTVKGKPYAFGVDFVANTGGRPRDLRMDQVVYYGMALDTMHIMSDEAVKGKYLLVTPFQPPAGFNMAAQQALVASNGYKAFVHMAGAAAGAINIADSIPVQARNATLRPTGVTINRDFDAPVSVTVTPSLAAAIFGKPLDALKQGDAGAPVTVHLAFIDEPRPLGRNVVAIVPGSDPKLRNEYVVIGAHNDHIPMQRARDHDSLRVFNMIARPQGADGGPRQVTPEEWVRINAMVDSLHKLHGGARVDSVSNGADDDGSGTVSGLELAEAFINAKVKPKRSLLFVWHAGEERGMWGSEYYANHPTVPRENIVAEINLDMLGRGAATDVTGQAKDGTLLHGGDKYVQLVGSRRLSTELGDIVEDVNNKNPNYHFTLDYALDANAHPQNIYCRSDHAMYAAWGIPVVFLTTGGHADYHQVTDEPQYIRYDHMALLDNMIYDIAARVANLDHRVVVDKPKPADPHGPCQQ